MKESLWGYWLIILGLAVIVIMMLLQNYSTTDQQDYYLLKEITEAAMADAVDWGHYEKYGELRIVKEKFIEDFTRRFSETVNISKNYNIKFYDIYEAPPKVSVKVTTKTDSFSVFGDASDSVDVVNKIDAILETNVKKVDTTTSTATTTTTTTPITTTNTGGVTTTTTKAVTTNTTSKTTTTSSIMTTTGNVKTTKSSSSKIYSCASDIVNATDNSLKGMRAVTMVSVNVRKGPGTSYSMIESLAAGKIVEIVGYKNNDNNFLIYYDGKCGWVYSQYLGISAVDYLDGSKVIYNITNAQASIYKSSEISIPNLTGKKLYTDDYVGFVPITYTFAKKVKSVTNNLTGGDKLVIYDAYRPHSVTTYAYNQLSAAIGTESSLSSSQINIIKNGMNKNGYNQSWFLASGTSAHNTGCAIDVSLANKNGLEYSMPTAMHELSVSAAKYTTAGSSAFTSVLADSNSGARKLHNYFMGVSGISDLKSEWWHYQDNNCHSTIKAQSSNGASFWATV